MTLTSLVAVQSNIHPGPNLPEQVNRFPVRCSVTYHAGTLLKLPLV